MPVLPKPSSNMDWTDGAAAKQVEPSAAKKLLGWVALERPPFEYMNFLFFNTDEWVKYLESVTDATTGALVVVVDSGGGGNFTDLQAAHDDAGTVAGTKIIIVSNLSLDATVTLTKPDIEYEMRSGKAFLKGGGAPAAAFTGVIISDTAKRTRFKHMKFGTSGAPFGGTTNIGLQLTANADNCLLFNPIFGPGNTADLDDLAATTSIVAPQNVSV